MNLFWLSKNELFPRSFSRFLEEQNIFISRICTNPHLAIAEYLSCGTGIVLMDFSWYSNDVSGVELLNEFLKLENGVKVIIITSYYQEAVHAKYRQLGAGGYFTKNDSPEHIIACIKDTLAGLSQSQGEVPVRSLHSNLSTCVAV